MTTALLIDAGFLRKEFENNGVNYDTKSVREMIQHIENNISKEDMGDKKSVLSSYKVFFYDAPIYQGKLETFSGQRIFASSKGDNTVLNQLKKNSDYVIREGRTIFSKWKLRDNLLDNPSLLSKALQAHVWPQSAYEPVFSQKEVDTLITMDLLSLNQDSLIDRIVLVSNDSDFVPIVKEINQSGKEIAVVSIEDQDVTICLKLAAQNNVYNVLFPTELKMQQYISPNGNRLVSKSRFVPKNNNQGRQRD